jgi:hypothetical protein
VRVNSSPAEVSPLCGSGSEGYRAPVPRNTDSSADRATGPDDRSRLSRLLLKPPPPGTPHATPAAPRSVEELEDDYLYANDKERIIGLVVAPIAAVIAVTVVGAQINHDPAAFLRNGTVNPKHFATGIYYELLGVMAVMAVGILATAWFRKRLYLGMLTALFGVAIFNLHWWGFGIPFAMVGAWYLVRASRAGRALKDVGISPREVTRKGVREEEEAAAGGYRASAQPFSKQFSRPASPRRRTSAVGR